MAPPVPPRTNRRSRTFTGCLTCRRRKVKCPDTNLPCRSCCRLNLDCEAPITKNIRMCSRNGTGRLSEDAGNIVLGSQTPVTSQSMHSTSTSQKNGGGEANWFPSDSPKYTGSEFDGPAFGASPRGAEDCTRNFRQTTVSLDSSWSKMNLYPEMQSSRFSAPRGSLFLASEDSESHLPSPTRDLDNHVEQRFDQPLEWLDGHLGWFEEPNLSMTIPLDITKSTYNASNSIMNSLPLTISPNLTSAAKEAETLQHYKARMATSFSVKDARWNIFTCLLEFNSELFWSPLKGSLIAWAATHLAISKSDFTDLALHHYSAASVEVTSLLEGFATSELTTTRPSSALRFSQISMFLASSFFLCQRDIIVCNISGFRHRINMLKELVKSSWYSLSTYLIGIDYRILLWLSYLDVRAAAFRPRVDNTGRETSETSLLTILSKEESPKSVYSRSRAYLNEGFGDAYPSYELQGDMLHDTVNARFAEAMSLLDEVISLRTEQPRYLRDSGAEDSSSPHGIRERLWDLRKECDLSLKGFLKNNQVYVTRTSYHWLNLNIVCCCAIILLNRHLNHSVWTDPEAQSAAREIITTTLRLRNANMLHNPHSIFSPFPLFIAGIEVDDEVYRDSTLSLLQSFSCWGLHVQRAIIALRRVIEKQGEIRCRCSMGEIIEVLGDEILL